MRIKGTVRYDGSRYYGFQIQKKPEMVSVQGEIQKALSIIYDREMKIFGAGRTDRGVHALNQVFHFDSEKEVDCDRLRYSMNRLLPPDIRILSLEAVSDEFHARFSAKKKHYRYIVNREEDPFMVHYALTWYKELDIEKIRKGMELFIGTHDFSCFCSNRDKEDSVRTIYDFTLKEERNRLIFDIIGSGFRRHMVRMMIGTLLVLGDHQIDTIYIEDRLRNPDVGTTAYSANPKGLYLVEVSYDPE